MTQTKKIAIYVLRFATVLALLVAIFPSPVSAESAGYALQFDGINDYVALNYTRNILASGWQSTKTVSLWVKPTGISPTCQYATIGYCDLIFGDKPKWWGIYRGIVNGNDRIWVWNWDGNSDVIAVPYTPGEWVHISLVHSGGVLRAYKNGVEVGNVPSGPTQQPPGSPVLHVGGIINSVNRNWTFQGAIDEVQIWTIARSAAEIQRDKNAIFVGNEPGLAAYYRMSDGAGLTLTDDSVFNWNGTLYDGGNGVPPDGQPPLWVPSGAFQP